ncbi:extracellular solute-binding protein [Halomarina rubra]|uniref:Extracellular solute-binding protein n=1 Tax=Halomarina rubra TaxID=2071873 RepID=A0ABD6AUD3_9EURY|nr:extracellular solute-binding protein [Halomarina rubra]
MPDKGSHTGGEDSSSVSRRTFVKAAGAGGAMAGLAGCIYGDSGGNGGGGGNGSGGNGSGNGSGGGSGGTVRFGFDPVAAQENGDAIVQALYDNGLSQDINVQLVPGAQDTGTRRDNYNRALRANENQPDMFLMDNGWVNIFIQRDLLQNLSQEAPSEVVDSVNNNYFEGFTATARAPESNDLYGVPVFPDFPTMQYRKDFAREAGYGDSDFETWATEPMTWQEWSQLTKEIQDATGTQYGFVTQWDVYEGTACCTFNEALSSWGGAYFGGRDNLFGPVGERPVTINEQPVVDSLRMMRTFVEGSNYNEALDGYAGGIMPNAVTGWKEEDARTAILEGQAVMQRNWPYAIALNAAEDELGTDAYGAMPIPYAVTESEASQQGTGGTTAALGGWHATVNPNSNNLEAVYQVLTAMTQDDFQLTLLEVQGWLPPKPALFDSQEAQDVPVLGEYMNTMKVAGENTMPRPVTPVWPQQASTIAQEANNVVSGSKSASQAMSDLQGAIEQIENQGA